MGKDGEGAQLKTIPRPFSTIEWSHENESNPVLSPTGVRFKGAQRPKWRPPAVEGSGESKDSTKQKLKEFQDTIFSSGQQTKQTEKTVPLVIHENLKREKDQLSMQLKALAEKYEGSKKRIAGLEQDLFTSQSLTNKYEGMYVIPLNDDLQALTDSIGEIDKDIKKFETAIVDNEGPPKSNFALPDSGAGKAQVLLETKVQRMEHLVYTLKKRVNKYENCVDDRSDTAKFDSKEFLRKENLRLTKEVKRLMTAEKRFDTESLLDNRALTSYDPMLFDVLITALQDDLKTHQRLLNQYSFEKNEGLQFLIASPAPLSEIQNLPSLLEEWGCDEEIMSATPGENIDVDTLKHENKGLKDAIVKLTSDYDQLNHQLEMERESSGVEGKRLTGKARKIELLMESNKDNLKPISDANMEVRKKDEIIAIQEQLQKKYIRDKEALMADCMSANKEVSKQRSRNQELRGAVEFLNTGLRAEETRSGGVHTLCLAMVQAFCLKSGVSDESRAGALRASIPSNFMDMWTTMSNATVVIQAASRGTLCRIKMAEKFGKEKVVSWSSRQDLDNKRLEPNYNRTTEDYESLGLSAAHAKKAVATNANFGKPRAVFTVPPLLKRFPATNALAELIKFSPKDQYRWVQIPELFKIVKAEVCADLKKGAEKELNTMKEEMVRLGCNMLRQVTVKTKEKRPQAVQVGPPMCNLADFDMQTDDEPPVPDDGGKKKK